VLEFGIIVDPESGREEGYMEYWEDLDIESINVEGEGKGRGERVKRSWVLRCEDEVKGVRGIVVRVGTWI
jgi:hypothetical protein